MASKAAQGKGAWLCMTAGFTRPPALDASSRRPDLWVMHALLHDIETALRDAFSPSLLVVEDESHLHAGHRGAAEHAAEFGEQAPSHVYIAITADRLEGLSRLARHRAVQDAIAEQVAQIHALRLTVQG